MASRATRLYRPDPMELAYRGRFGAFPDHDFIRRLEDGQPLDEVTALINGRIDSLWREMQEEHRQRGGFLPVGERDACPFQ